MRAISAASTIEPEPVEDQVGHCDCGAEVRRAMGTLSPAYRRLLMRTAFVCGACQAALDAEDAERERLATTGRAERARAKRLERCGIPSIFRARRVDSIEQEPEILAAARKWVIEGGGLALLGGVGVLKSTLAAAAAWEAIDHGHRLRWASMPLIMAQLGTGLGTSGRDHAIELLIGSHAVVLDDLDKARPTAYGAEHVFAAIDSRLVERRRFIVTTNLTLRGLAEKWPEPYGEAIASRIEGHCEVVRLAGGDRRMSA